MKPPPARPSPAPRAASCVVSAKVSSKVRWPSRQHGDQRKDDPPAVLVGPDAEEQADQRSGQDRGADQQAELGIVQPSSALISIPMIAKIVQTAKQAVKAMVLSPRARLPLFREMHEGQRDRIFSGSFLQVFPPQLTLFELGQRPDFLHVLVDGLVELYAHSAGRDTTMRIVEPVTSFILAAVVTDQPYLMSARTLVASRILLVPAALVREVVKDDCALMQATMRELAQAYRGMVRALTDMKLRQSAERLGNLILDQDRLQGGNGKVVLKAEKRLLASLLGMTPENLSRGFGLLAAHGIEVSGAQVTITDRPALEAYSRPDPVRDDPA
jgi:CRP/FNR family transcriptional activator FtrB